MNVQSVVYPDRVPRTYQQWRFWHFYPANAVSCNMPNNFILMTNVEFVEFKDRQPAPDLRRMYVIQLSMQRSFQNIFKKLFT